MNKWNLYEGKLSYDELNKLNFRGKIMTINKQITEGQFNLDNFLINKGDKVYVIHKYVLGKNEMKKLAKHYEFILVDNIKDANIVVFPSYKNNDFFYVNKKYKEKTTGKVFDHWYYASRVKGNENDYEESIYVYSTHDKLIFNTEFIDNLQDKVILNENYFKYYHFLLDNPQKETTTDYNSDSIFNLLKSKDQVNVDIAITILKNKNVNDILSELVLLYYDRNVNDQTKVKMKNGIFDKIPFLKNSIDPPKWATFYSVSQTKRIIDILENNNVKFNYDYFLDDLKNASKKTGGLRSFNNGKFSVQSLNEVNMIYNAMLDVEIELSNEQLKKIIFRKDDDT